MDIGNWITLAAVLVALGLGVSSLVQTQRLQKRERKDRLLNEIIDWVVDISNCGIPNKGFEDWRELAIKYLDRQHVTNIEEVRFLREVSLTVFSQMTESCDSFIRIAGKSLYINEISKYFGPKLQNDVKSLVTELAGRIKLLDKALEDIGEKEIMNEESGHIHFQKNFNDTMEELGKHRDKLNSLVHATIKEASKIKCP